MERRRLGRLGHESSVLIYGAAALSDVTPERADGSIALALRSGINHFDTSDDYGDSELHLGRWMPRIRGDVFLATKTSEPSKAKAAGTIRRSLERLRVDHVELIQLHAICTIGELDEVTGPGGALEAAVEARDEGLAGAIGITGHGVDVAATHLEALRRFPFDTILTPYSYRLARDPGFRRHFEALLERVRADDVGLMLIKHVARNLWPDSADRRTGTTWYQPLDEVEWIDAAVAFALRLEGATGLCTPDDVELLPRIVEAERRAASITDDAIAAALDRVPSYESPFVPAPGRRAPSWLPQHR